MADVTARQRARHLAVREFGPWLGLLACWALVALAVGHADAVRLFAAWTIVRSVRSLTATAVLRPLRSRMTPEGGIGGQALKQGRTAVLLSFAAAVLALALAAALLKAAGLGELALLCALLSIGLPARYLAPLAARKLLAQVYRPASTWGGAALVAGAWIALGADVRGVAVAFALREWLALGLALAFAPDRRPKGERTDGLDWPEIAAASADLSRRRLSYRLGKGVLSALFGPVGTIVARGGRGLKLDRHLHQRMPQSPLSIALLALATAASAIAMLALSTEPAVLVVAASLFMVAAVSVNALFWSAIAGNAAVAADDDDMDED